MPGINWNRRRKRGPLSARFWLSVLLTPGCWKWTGVKTGTGYGRILDGEKGLCAHRVSYELMYGPIPPGMIIDHLCRNRACVRPDHLEIVTHKENILRGIGPTAVNAQKTHCPKGHPLSGANLHLDTNGWRVCRECRRQACRRQWRRKVKRGK